LNSDSDYKDQVEFYLNALDELGAVLIDEDKSSGISRGILRIILGTMMAPRGAIFIHSSEGLKVMAVQGNKKLKSPLPWSEEVSSQLREFKHSSLSGGEIDSLLSDLPEKTRRYFSELGCELYVPLYHKNSFIGLLALGRKFTNEDFTETEMKILEIICNHLTDALYNQELIEDIQEKRTDLRLKLLELQTLFDVSLAISSVLDMDSLTEEVLIRAAATLNASTGFVLMAQENSPILKLKASFNADEDHLNKIMFSTTKGVLAEIWKGQEPKMLSVDDNTELQSKIMHDNLLLAPLIGKDGVLGCLVLCDKESRTGIGPFASEDLEMLMSLAAQAGVAMDNARLFRNITDAKRFSESIMGSIATAVITTNLLGEIDSVNDAGLRILQMPSEEIIGNHYQYLFENDSAVCDVILAAETNRKIASEMHISFTIGSDETMINISAAPLTDYQNQHLGMVIAIEDISIENKIKNTFKRYVSKQVVDQLLDDERALNLGGEEREVTILFSDIRGFTTMSENMTPEKVVSTLNEYFSEMIDIVFKHNGTLDKIVGDELMVIYGAPISSEDDSTNAIETAITMTESLNKLNNKRIARNDVPINIGIGINRGKVISGNIGSKDQMDYTVIGDTVNLGSRLCSVAQAGQILISKAAKEHARGSFNFHELDPIELKGKAKPIQIYEVM
jgi:adenylate cyclase|tara:strand:+ start:29980 stop:32013 length:2034 start_codon:yes stop_codon:yes gene_type:complete